jgi:hypothetical protein
LITVHNVKRILFPIAIDVILLESCGEDFVARIIDRDTEGLEDFHAWSLTSASAPCPGIGS